MLKNKTKTKTKQKQKNNKTKNVETDTQGNEDRDEIVKQGRGNVRGKESQFFQKYNSDASKAAGRTKVRYSIIILFQRHSRTLL